MRIQSILIAFLLLICSQQCLADPGDITVGIKGGTLGVGGEVGVGIGSDVVLRGGINALTFSFDSTISDVDYTMESKFTNGSLLLDWHLFSGAFRVTGGFYLNGNEITVDGTYRKDLIPLEYQQYAALTDLAHIKGSVDFNSIAPYAGLGWLSNHGEKGWGVAFDMGVLFQGKPNVSELYIEGPAGIETHPEAVQFLDEQKKSIEDELDNFQYYPVASLTLNYNF